MDGTAWVSTAGITFTDEELLKRQRRSQLSASAAQSLSVDSCAAGMIGDRLLPRDDDAMQANQLGTAAHAVFEKLFQLDKPERTKDRADQLLDQLGSDRDFALDLIDVDLVDRIAALDATTKAAWTEAVRERVHGLWLIEDPTQVDVHYTEMSFGKRAGRVVHIGRVPFIGFIDRVDQIVDQATGEITGYAVADYKAGKYKTETKFGDDYGDQIRLYVEAVRQAEGIAPSSGKLLFVHAGRSRTIEIDAASMARTIEQFERAWDRQHQLVTDNFFPAKVGPLCGWCKLVNACPAAIAAGKTDLSDTEKVNGRRQVVPGKASSAVPAALISMPAVAAPIDFTQPLDEQIHPESAPAAHRSDDSAPAPKDQTMTDQPYRFADGTSSRETYAGTAVNAISYAACGTFGLASLAVEELTRAGLPVNARTVNGLANTFATVIRDASLTLEGKFDYGDGMNTRLRGALRTAVETMPLPFGGTVEDFAAWTKSATNRVSAIASVALALIRQGQEIPDQPWAALAGAAQQVA